MDYEQKYKRLLIGETIKGNKHTIYELMSIMVEELNINTLSFQKAIPILYDAAKCLNVACRDLS